MKVSERGISLIELLLGVCIMVVVATTISLSIPMASRHILINRQRWEASSLANTQIQSLKNQPYDYLDTTDVTFPPASYPQIFTAANPTCDCNQVDFSTLPSTVTVVAGVNFTVTSCVNFVSVGALAAQCNSVGDTGYKHILVKAIWQLWNSTASVTEESISTRA